MLPIVRASWYESDLWWITAAGRGSPHAERGAVCASSLARREGGEVSQAHSMFIERTDHRPVDIAARNLSIGHAANVSLRPLGSVSREGVVSA